ncbi:hypothetical protein AA0121_g4205 [Alternaria tenuissima]|uniref:LPXTG cell wall anchor domain-containing protein n=1 Tax=Alternaria tenuissima TaxID=119927 RepID=A0AB37WL66_9PLEO|nr:hypothetical protein AA0115_g4620 [Alternaria tenuissima]RYN62637.1 hypothetical protein AA0118_g5498 [Alternaria tenuissima]RYN87480.1 hypothetical protein AA0120_g7316 [Alternaria tenuissima]RYO19437.1 hypothetical protein AA0121_g4205 [Alternaria tenuissima]
MGIPSQPASNAIIYLTLGAFLVLGCYVAWRLRHQSKTEWLSSNRTQKGQTLSQRPVAAIFSPPTLRNSRRHLCYPDRT